MSSTPSTLGTYPVERELGRGGMGVVYLARDPRLDRQVAIKVLPDLLTLNPDHLARFDREAKLLASLNHPNIAAIYGIEVDGTSQRQLLVLEYVPGDTLATRIARGPLPIDEALDVCRQIALAVEAAHEGGVIHRDLKPGNVKVTPDGQVKVLDFGLAKGGAPDGGRGFSPGNVAGSKDPASINQMPTMTSPAMTAMGIILGTAGYMSPEQARGKVVDKRTDIWSFGCVLFECLTGRQPFEGETVSDTIAKILEREPDWAAVPASTPPKVRQLLRRCLERDAKKRQRDIGDVRIELEEALAARASSSRVIAAPMSEAGAAAPGWRMWAIPALCFVLGAAAVVGFWSVFGSSSRAGSVAARGPLRFSVGIPPSIDATYAGFTGDGRSLLVYGYPKKADGTDEPSARLYTRGLDGYEFKPIPGTEGISSFARSPDGAWIAFVATVSAQSSQRRLSKVRIDGSAPPVVLADWDDAWGTSITWLEDGDLLIWSTRGTEFFRLPSGGGSPKPAIKLDTGAISGFPSFGNRLPGDRGVFLTLEVWAARGYQVDQWLLDPKSGKARRLFENAGNAVYVPTGDIVFTRGEALMAAPFDLKRLAVTGEVVALENGVRTNAWAHGGFEIADDGSLIYPPGGRLGTDRQLITVDAAGTIKPFTAERRPYELDATATRDGRKVAVVLSNSKGTFETWVADLDRPALKRALALPNADCAGALWSPDGRRLAYTRTARDQDDGVYVQAADGSAPPQLVLKGKTAESFVGTSSWVPDGSGLIVGEDVAGKTAFYLVPIAADGSPGTPRTLHVAAGHPGPVRLSPDGRLAVFNADDSGRDEIYVSTYGTGGTFGSPVMVSSGGGTNAEWAGDSRRLFYFSAPGKVMTVTVDTRSGISASAPVVAWDLKKVRSDASGWNVLPDGRLLAIQRGDGEDDIPEFRIVLNWFDELKAKMGKR